MGSGSLTGRAGWACATALGAVVAAWVGLTFSSQPSAQALEAPAPKASETVVAAQTPASAAMERQFQSQVRPFLQQHCYKCHANGKHKGDVTLDRFTGFASIQGDLDTWQQVHDELAQHDMPPEKEPQPSADELSKALKFTSAALDFVDPAAPRDPGFVPIHRLNRTEYNNTIRDLVGVDFHPADDFP
ncbi:MAG TPA: DUF1587 domain-containing protein, partial [Tepidisphaeraceae bacterium]